MNRRHLLESLLAFSGATLTARSSFGLSLPHTSLASEPIVKHPIISTFPAHFMWGAATSAYQVEGAWNVDGKAESIWDRFVHTPGHIKNGDTGDVACDSYHRYKEDVALLRELNCKSYRFSISWARVLPTMGGPPNQKGLDYYRRLTDELLANGIRPLATLYHWDMPQQIEDAGGWPNRDTADRYVDYVAAVAHALGDRIDHWCIFNEARTFTQLGYWFGKFAPGRKDPLAFLRATHTVNLAQGKAFVVLKARNRNAEVGSSFDPAPMIPATHSAADVAAADQWFRLNNLWHVWPALTGQYPDGVLPADRLPELLDLRNGDEVIMRAPFDYVGLNYYTRWTVRAVPPGFLGIPGLMADAQWATGPHEKTDLDWDIYPEGFYDIVTKMSKLMGGHMPIEITESGAAYDNLPDAHGVVHDPKRVDYLRGHLRELARAIHDGAPVRAYHIWSLLDNFEWAEGYSQHFGLVSVNMAQSQQRTIKDSGHWYAKMAAANRVL
ncbi:MAG TPA: GH1 family beta-glucosidase [Steroidobacteraceae bacterium]